LCDEKIKVVEGGLDKDVFVAIFRLKKVKKPIRANAYRIRVI